MKIDGKNVSTQILEELKPQIISLKSKGIFPTLAIILIGNNKASQSYIKQKQLKAKEIGIRIELFRFESISEKEFLTLINKLNADPLIHGIIVQRPLPVEFNRDLISDSIIPEKDVDGFNPNSNFDAPVALAVMEILKSIGLNDLANKRMAVIGRGETAGLPIIKFLIKSGLEPTIISQQTQNPDEIIKSADIIITAVGKENIIKAENLNSNQILIGVGLFSKEDKLKGDYEEKEIENKVKYFTPTPGGVGPVNVSCLLKNLITSCNAYAASKTGYSTTGN